MWDKTEPCYGQHPIFVTHLRTMVAIGTFVTLQDRQVCRLVEHFPASGNVLVNLFLSSRCDGHSSNHRINSSDGQHQELIQSSKTEVIAMTQIADIVWVIPPEKQHDNCLGDGIANIYTLRYRSDDTSALPFHMFPDDASGYPLDDVSVSKTIFLDLMRIVDGCDLILNREALSQGTFACGRSRTFIHPVTWSYIRRQCDRVVKVHDIQIKTKRKRTESGVELRSYEQNNIYEYLRFQSETALDKLGELVGPTPLCGNRAKRPKVGHPYVPNESSLMNVVIPSPYEPLDIFRRRTTARGVDFCSDGFDFRIFIRYKKTCIGGSNYYASTFLKKCFLRKLAANETSGMSESDDDDDDGSAIQIGMAFRERGIGRVLRIYRIESDRYIAVPETAVDDQDSISIPKSQHGYLLGLIDDYL